MMKSTRLFRTGCVRADARSRDSEVTALSTPKERLQQSLEMAAAHLVDLFIGEIEILAQFLDHDLAQDHGQVIPGLAPHVQQRAAKKDQNVVIIGNLAFDTGRDLAAAAKHGDQVV